jgi:hypothetical protein
MKGRALPNTTSISQGRAARFKGYLIPLKCPLKLKTMLIDSHPFAPFSFVLASFPLPRSALSSNHTCMHFIRSSWACNSPCSPSKMHSHTCTSTHTHTHVQKHHKCFTWYGIQARTHTHTHTHHNCTQSSTAQPYTPQLHRSTTAHTTTHAPLGLPP